VEGQTIAEGMLVLAKGPLTPPSPLRGEGRGEGLLEAPE
jgi:hypothetical protein